MQEASDALSKTADNDTFSTYQVSSVQLVYLICCWQPVSSETGRIVAVVP